MAGTSGAGEKAIGVISKVKKTTCKRLPAFNFRKLSNPALV